MRSEEMSITVPWGHVAAKTWGDSHDPHILAFHGVADNAGSFDNLIPHLPGCYYYICFDLPGHGKSSYFPPSLPIHSEDFIVFYKLMVEHFGRERYILMGHSLGGQMCSLFARLYPQYVEKLILLDTVHSLPVHVENFHTFFRNTYDFIAKLNDKMVARKIPTYSYEEAVNKVVTPRQYSVLTKEAAAMLLKRSLIPCDSGRFYFSTDPRIKYFMNPAQSLEYITESLKAAPFRCPVLIILGTECQIEAMKPVIGVFKKNWLVTIRYISPGHHDIHITDSELVAGHINSFLTQKNSKM